MTDHADMIARLRAHKAAAEKAGGAGNDLLGWLIADLAEAADALSRPVTVTEEMVERIVREVAELPDRTSPDDAPDMLMVTEDELRAILTAALGTSLQKAQGSPADNPAARTGACQPPIVGTIGHVDSGKRSLTAAIAKVLADTAKPSLAPQPTGPGPETYPGHDPAAGLPRSPDTAGGAEPAGMSLEQLIASTEELQDEFNVSRGLPPRYASIRAEATAKERERCAGDAFKAALFSYLINQHAYSFGISWDWQQSKPGVPRMIDQLAEDALQYFERYINEMDPGDEPTDWDSEVMRHAAAIRGGGND